MRALWLAVLLLAGCSSEGGGTFERIGTLAADRLFGEDAPVPPEVTRAQLDQIPFATIAVSFQAESGRAFVVPLADNDGYLTYQDQNRRGLVLLGGAVAGTDGLSQDLLGVRHASGDPIAYPTRLADWPGQIDREYQYKIRDLQRFSITVTCVYARDVREEIEIVERRYQVVRMLETCTSPRRQFTNLYWVEPDSGFVWRSRQWLGPQLNPALIEIIRPYDPA
ncbi:MAG: YjbF family lipoprotein [Pseudomonadota bacterium]